MSGEENNSEEVREQPGPLAGQRLAAARKSRNMDIATVAAELHIDADKVRALEDNRFADLGASVYTKGYLRRYARLVGIPTDDVFAEYYELTRSDTAPAVIITRRRQPRDWSLGPWLVGLVIVAILSAIAIWWFTGPFGGDNDAAAAGTEPDARKTDTVILPPATSPQTETVVVSETPANADTDLGADELLGDAPIGSASSDVSLMLYFRGDCWAEVSDATGARLFYDLGKTGRTVEVSGAAPITVLLGDSSQVEIEVDGRSFDIPADRIEGTLARFQISKQ